MKNTTYEVPKSDEYLNKAKKVIPGGIFGHYKYALRESGPKFFLRSEGAYFWDVDENRYIDLMCGYGPSILGYNHPEVEEAYNSSAEKGNTVSLASPVMVDLATKLVDIVDAADWALFGKNGGDATSLAVMIAREYTGKRKIIKIDDGYHGVAPWMQDKERPGILSSDNDHVLKVKWNDLSSVEELLFNQGDDIACFISSPYDHPVSRDNSLPEEKVYFTGTQFFSAPPMAAAIATLDELKKFDAPKKLIKYGEKLNKRLVLVAKQKGFNLIASGMPSMPYYRLDGVSFETHIKWIDECVKRGVYMLAYHNHFISLAHSEKDIDFIEGATKQAFEAL